MNIVIREGLIESEGQVYRWRYDMQSEYFSLSSLNENRIIVKIVSLQDFTNLGIVKLVETELAILGMLHTTSKMHSAPLITFNRVDEPEENNSKPVDMFSDEELKTNLNNALEVEDYEKAVVYRDELNRRNKI